METTKHDEEEEEDALSPRLTFNVNQLGICDYIWHQEEMEGKQDLVAILVVSKTS
jgi:hypothetical protein